jgi:tetrahydromethanopterin S-methyltransferase subunit G
MNNLVVQLLLKTGTFSTDLKTAKGQVQNFQKGCQDAGKSLNAFGSAMGINVGALAKFGGAIGAAALAGKELKAIIDSSQTSADAFQGAIAGCKGVLDTFNTAIATADFSAFANGLWDVYDSAKAVQDALDQLANTQIAYDFKSKENMTKFQEAYNVFKDPQSTAQMKEDAKKQMQEAVDAQFAFANNYSSSLYKTYVAQVVNQAGSANLSALNVTRAQFERAMNIDLGLEGDPQKARDKINSEYQHYLSLLDEYRNDWWDRNINGYGEYRNITGVEKIKKQYADVIAIHAMLELMADDELKGVAQLIGGMEDAKQQALSMEKTMNRVINGSDRPTTTRPRTTKKEELPVDEGSLTYWQKILQEETQYRDALVKDTEEWKEHNAKVEEAKAKIEEINGKIEKTSSAMEGSLTWYKQILSEATKLRDETEYGTEAWNKYNEKVKFATQMISLLESNYKLDEALAVDPPTIESLQTVLSILQQMRNQAAIDSDEFKELSEWIDKLQKKLQSLNGTNITKSVGKNDSFSKITSSISTLTSGLYTLSDAFMKISGDAEGTENEFKKFLDVVQTGVSVFQAMASIIQTVNSLQELFGATALTSAGQKVAADTMSAESTAAAAGTEVAANTAVAVSGAASSQASIPIVGPALAVAAAAAVLAAIIAAISSSQKIQKFANGGIVGGSSFTGDRVTANVNSGEMILNRTQQANLFRMANGSGVQGNQVEFHISGTDLVGVLNNNNRKNRLTR